MQQREHIAVQRRVRIGVALAFDRGIGGDQLVVEGDFIVGDCFSFRGHKGLLGS
jgi:hypothetical protein